MSGADLVRTYVEWTKEGQVVSSQDLADHHGLSVDYVHGFLHNEKIAGYIARRFNVAPPPKYKSRKSLTDEQRAWLDVITNPYTGRTLNGMIAAPENSSWMSMSKHRTWMKQAHFLHEYKRLMALEVRGTEGEMVRRTASRAMTGDPKSVELLYRMQGEPLPTSIAGGSGNMVALETVLTALQKELSTEQMSRVAARLMNPNAELPNEIEMAELVESVDDSARGSDGSLASAIDNES